MWYSGTHDSSSVCHIGGLRAGMESRENDVMSPDGVEEFLDEVAIYDLEAKTDDRTD